MISRRLKWFVHVHRQRMQLIRKEMQRVALTLSDSEIPFAVVSALANIRLQSYHFPRTGMDRCFLGNYFCMVKPKSALNSQKFWVHMLLQPLTLQLTKHVHVAITFWVNLEFSPVSVTAVKTKHSVDRQTL